MRKYERRKPTADSLTMFGRRLTGLQRG